MDKTSDVLWLTLTNHQFPYALHWGWQVISLRPRLRAYVPTTPNSRTSLKSWGLRQFKYSFHPSKRFLRTKPWQSSTLQSGQYLICMVIDPNDVTRWTWDRNKRKQIFKTQWNQATKHKKHVIPRICYKLSLRNPRNKNTHPPWKTKQRNRRNT